MKKVKVEPEEISQDELTYRLDNAVSSDILMISFAVFPAPGGKSAFDFIRATNPLGVKRLFLRDPNMMWYQKGSPGDRRGCAWRGGVSAQGDRAGKGHAVW